jgi:hypothetical protein
MYRKQLLPSLGRGAGTSLFLGLFVFLLSACLELVLNKLGANGMGGLLDNLLIGLVAGAVVFAYEFHRHKLMVRQMQVIANMNHHVRNALQPIMYSPYMKGQAEQIRMIQLGTERIQWALREVLPGNFDDPPPLQGSRTSA